MTTKRKLNLTSRELYQSLLSPAIKDNCKTTVLGGKEKADGLRDEAAKLRAEHDLCLHGDEEVFVRSEAMRKIVDSKPNLICQICLKPKLRIPVAIDGGTAEIEGQEALAVIEEFGIPRDLLK